MVVRVRTGRLHSNDVLKRIEELFGTIHLGDSSASTNYNPGRRDRRNSRIFRISIFYLKLFLVRAKNTFK